MIEIVDEIYYYVIWNKFLDYCVAQYFIMSLKNLVEGDFYECRRKIFESVQSWYKRTACGKMFVFLAGFTVATWAPMIPAVKERLQIGDDVLGMLLLCIGISAFIFMPIAGILNQKLGCKKILRVCIIAFALILVVISFWIIYGRS